MNAAVTYVLTLVVFAGIDTVWLGTMGDRLYRPLIGSMLAENFRLAPAIAFYALYAAGLTVFAVLPGLAEGGWKKALLWGGLLGLFAYGTYDLTNLATLKSWSLKLSLIDMAWGLCVSAAASAISCALVARFLRAPA
uniref:Transmembrane protein n=1 Tax=Caulobacter sp. (strain K31) TaxID=366602 RepID=B0T1C5_CAUSK